MAHRKSCPLALQWWRRWGVQGCASSFYHLLSPQSPLGEEEGRPLQVRTPQEGDHHHPTEGVKGGEEPKRTILQAQQKMVALVVREQLRLWKVQGMKEEEEEAEEEEEGEGEKGVSRSPQHHLREECWWGREWQKQQ
jgi:hypothetical protein